MLRLNCTCSTPDWCACPGEVLSIGDRVRSYDFDRHNDTYMEGTITGLLPFDRYTIEVTRIMFGGVEQEVPPEFRVHPPINGRPHWLNDHPTNYVRKLPK